MSVDLLRTGVPEANQSLPHQSRPVSAVSVGGSYRRSATGLLCCLAIFFAVLFPIAASGDIYSYVDKNGVRHFSNAPVSKRFQPFLSTVHSDGGTGFLGTESTVSSSGISYRPVSYYDGYIRQASRQYQVDPLLIKAVIKAESNFNPRAVSPNGARGLMQLMPATASHVRVADPFDPRQNINGGTRYLRQMLDSFQGNIPLSLAAYNAGPTRVAQLGAIPKNPETKNYVSRVMKLYKTYRRRVSRSITRNSTIRVGRLAIR